MKVAPLYHELAGQSWSRELTVVFAVHLRPRRRLEEFALLGSLTGEPAIRLTEPFSPSS